MFRSSIYPTTHVDISNFYRHETLIMFMLSTQQNGKNTITQWQSTEPYDTLSTLPP